MLIQGSYVALATPFKDGVLDEASFGKLIAAQVAGGTDGLIPCGTTGEAPALTAEEWARCVSLAVQHKQGRVVLAGCGTAATASTIENVRKAKALGADGALVVTPYYVKPTQAGIVAHFRAIAKAVPGFPLMLYVVPGRTGGDVLPETYPQLAEIAEIVAVKEATGSAQRILDIRDKVGDRFALLSGDDLSLQPFLAAGGKGVVSVTANVAPKHMAELVHAALAGDHAKALRIQLEIQPLNRDLFTEVNPIPVKAALSMLGIGSDELRLPLTPATPATREKLQRSLTALGLL